MQTHQKVFWGVFLGFVAVVLIVVLSMDSDQLEQEGTAGEPQQPASIAPDTTTAETGAAEAPAEETPVVSSKDSVEAEKTASAEEETRRRRPPEGPRQPQWDAEAIQRVVNSHNAAIQDCYQQELKKTPSLRGRVIVRITIHPDGYVTDAEIVGASLRNNAVLDCILRRVRNWSDFDPVDPSLGEITIRQTYRFGM